MSVAKGKIVPVRAHIGNLKTEAIRQLLLHRGICLVGIRVIEILWQNVNRSCRYKGALIWERIPASQSAVWIVQRSALSSGDIGKFIAQRKWLVI